MNKEEEMLDAIFQNAIRFLNISIDEIIHSDFSEMNSVVKTSVFIQMTVELSLKYAIAYNMGNISIKKILTEKYKNHTVDEIYEEYLKNALKVDSFERLKNHIKNIPLFKFNKNEEIEKMEQFQKIRNRLLHFSYHFTSHEISNAKENFIYIVFKIVFPLLYEGYSVESLDYLAPSDFIKVYVGTKKFEKIRSMDEYKKVMLNIADTLKHKGEITIGRCIYCNETSWIKEIGKCILCEYDDRDDVLLRCPACRENKSVIYESINMEYNNNATTGICISCNRKMSVIKCKKCGRYNVYEDDIAFLCAIEGLDESVCDMDCDPISKKNKLPSQYAFVIPAIVISDCIHNNEISVLNKNKNIPKILGKKSEHSYILNNDVDDAVLEGISYLVNQEYVSLNIKKEEILERVHRLIEEEYTNGSFSEMTGLYERLFFSVHSEETGKKFYEVLDHLVQRQFKELTQEEYEILYECRDNLDIDTKIFFGMYKHHELVRPSEIK
ncbi:hypothetical protein [Paenibacillus cookii]|uniref:Thaumarchaeal output domain-containing protein n=1 Tax=Paenibacillus cookii TaxID=157839 RepID=A0ABQ4LV67_9BACL|nr:hypothetical protein [Paenibacillus cookii]GIO67170.1 hypothetical protein J21TS3_19910 [Paenibacillus cookii]